MTDWRARAAVPLCDDRVLLRPVTPADRDGLRAIALDPRIWRWFVTRVDTETDFRALFDGMLTDSATGRRIVFAVVDRRSGRLAGSTSYGNLSEPDRRLEIGWSWLGVEFQGSGINPHVKGLLLDHAFTSLGAERVEFKTDQRNVQARRALRNIGAVEEGILRSYNPMPDGRRRDAVFYSVVRPEWPEVRARLTDRIAVAAPAGGR
jgi:RimJ/RimL family protein N-acetyltransferase